MTVIKERSQSFVYPDSNNTSDSESLHIPIALPSDVEPDNNVDSSTSEASLLKLEDDCDIRRNPGRRRLRRFNNRIALQVLAEESEENENPHKLREHYRSHFATVLENESNFERWNTFVNLPEEEQKAFLDNDAKKVQSDTKKKTPPKISARIKRAIKIKKNLSMDMVEKLEKDIVSYFMCSPQGIYVASPSTSFERLLIHAIAQYHVLKSKSVNEAKRSVEVTCSTVDLWKPMEESLCDFVKQFLS